MKLIPIDSLIVKPNRQRREFDLGLLNELGSSIQRIGLLMAPVCRAEQEGNVLVAGERRLRAIKDIYDLGGTIRYAGVEVPAGMVPVISLGDLSPLEAEEAELEENIRRTDLTWVERAEATSRLAALRTKQAMAADKPLPTVAEIAREVRDIPPEQPVVGDQHTSIRNEIIVARHLADPEVRAAPSLKEAMKILKKREEQQKNTDLAALIGPTFTSQSHRLEQAEAVQWLLAAAPEQWDIILTDPPYGMGADEFGDSGQGVAAEAHFYDDSYEAWKELMLELPAALYRAAQPAAHAYLFCDVDRYHELKLYMENAGWKVHRTPLIWHNTSGYRAPWPSQGPQRQYELILYAVKGDKPVTKVAKDVLIYARDKNLGHPAQKPVDLLEDLLRRSSTPASKVLDCCAGSGATIEAAHRLKIPCTALEKLPQAYGVAVTRLQSLSATDPALF
ncbi:MAG: hypothetical protein E6Q97_36150 [Desulfurellales bacterium]|nr:MAG: hypothetical protein E6Q97_36150 [Desulfurellales bacterium]